MKSQIFLINLTKNPPAINPSALDKNKNEYSASDLDEL